MLLTTALLLVIDKLWISESRIANVRFNGVQQQGFVKPPSVSSRPIRLRCE